MLIFFVCFHLPYLSDVGELLREASTTVKIERKDTTVKAQHYCDKFSEHLDTKFTETRHEVI